MKKIKYIAPTLELTVFSMAHYALASASPIPPVKEIEDEWE